MRILDLFCGQGGAAVGYHMAGFEVVGVDIDPQPRYPFEFHQGDALEYLAKHGGKFDAIHASPPCQAYSRATTSGTRGNHPRMIAPLRSALGILGKPYVIENVEGAPLISPVRLCGSMFDLEAQDTDGQWLRLERHRLFETNFTLVPPRPCRHNRLVPVAGVYGGGASQRKSARRGGYTPSKQVREALMGITHMTQNGLSQAIPPVYAAHIGLYIKEALDG